MSLRSMTGYGRAEVSQSGVQVLVELSAVNRRQLDIQYNLPRAFSGLESRVTEEIQKFVFRGRISANVHTEFSSKLREKGIHVDQELAAGYLKALRGTARELGLGDDFNASLLLNLPDVIRYEQAAEDIESVWPTLRTALRKALNALNEMRKMEGNTLAADLEGRLVVVQQQVDKIRIRAPHSARQYQAGLKKRVTQAGVSLEESDDRLLREIAIYADRIDITEELTRLESHLGQARKLMKSKEAAGKSLDFLAQEMFREVNTIASKANDSKIAHHVIRCKSELDRFREQAQNIE